MCQREFTGLDKPDQFFAVPSINPADGATMAETLIDVLECWENPKENTIGTCWDTTASNTGKNKGAATLFESSLGKALLWFTCRHHIGESHIIPTHF